MPLQLPWSLSKKQTELNKGKELFIQDAAGMPILKSQQIHLLGNGYINKGAALYQEEDLENSLKNFEKAQKILPNDTLCILLCRLRCQWHGKL